MICRHSVELWRDEHKECFNLDPSGLRTQTQCELEHAKQKKLKRRAPLRTVEAGVSHFRAPGRQDPLLLRLRPPQPLPAASAPQWYSGHLFVYILEFLLSPEPVRYVYLETPANTSRESLLDQGGKAQAG